MIGDLYDADDVVVGQAAVLFAAANTAMADVADLNPEDPFDLDPWESVGAGLWVPTGATDQGWSFGANKSTTSIAIEEQSTPVGTTIASQAVTIAGALSEDISRTLALAYNALRDVNAPTATLPGFDDLTLDDEVHEYAVALITTNAEGFGRWIYAPRWTQLANTTTAFRRASAKRMYPVEFGTVCKPSEIHIINFTAEPTA